LVYWVKKNLATLCTTAGLSLKPLSHGACLISQKLFLFLKGLKENFLDFFLTQAVFIKKDLKHGDDFRGLRDLNAWSRCYDYKNISAKISGKIFVFDAKYCSFISKPDHNVGFLRNTPFFTEKWLNSPKTDNNIDP
jgi:hypothetical protein